MFAEEIHKGRNEQVALLKARNEWEGNAYVGLGEKNDPYNAMCHKNIDLDKRYFKDTAQLICLPILEHQTRHTG